MLGTATFPYHVTRDPPQSPADVLLRRAPFPNSTAQPFRTIITNFDHGFYTFNTHTPGHIPRHLPAAAPAQ
ncbi:Hypp3324 [Branchiostoma lanceolatum]|uniref:Hypp3324 protein n=1 Tax=Branchiostoma lanceolatum TaxID=7740 RepID=A0A8K0A472_BRALA|nr:Hypp3324 [Branchiostoma lanceolatum]